MSPIDCSNPEAVRHIGKESHMVDCDEVGVRTVPSHTASLHRAHTIPGPGYLHLISYDISFGLRWWGDQTTGGVFLSDS